jgi:signal transduction histidine kinase/ligand-binding sensor domain-containing protein/DNA-binding response OmpR family regulator
VSIAQDRKGLIWIGTKSGLNQFDGYKFKIFRNSDILPNSINSNELNPIFADKHEDQLWIATEKNGINVYDYDNNKFSYFVNETNNHKSLIANGITWITDNAEGNLWIASYQRGIDYFNKKTRSFTHFNQSNVKGLGSDYNWCVMDDRQGNLYVGHVFSGMSVISVKDRTAVNYQHIDKDPTSIPNNIVNCITIDSQKHIWVGTLNGLALFNPKSKKFIVFQQHPKNPNSLSSNLIQCITEVNGNSLWIGTLTGGINILNLDEQMFSNPEKVSFQHITASDSPYGLSNPEIQVITQDSFGNIWIGTSGGGVNFIQSKPDFFNQITYLPTKGNNNSLSNKIVPGLCIDADGKLWVATLGGGIDVYNNNIKIANFNKSNNPVIDNNILTAYKDSEKNLWFGSDNGKIIKYDYKSKQFNELKGFDNAGVQIRSFYEDSRHNLWITSDRGLHEFNLKTKKQNSYYCVENGLTDNVLRSVSEDKNGRIWVGTLGGGLDIFSPDFKLLRHFDTGNGFYGINQIYRDSKNRMWIGTRSGLILFRNCTDTIYQTFGLKDGFEDNYFHSMVEGKSADELWLSTTNGISYFNLKNKLVRNFNKYDGIPLGDYLNSSIAKTPDGIIYFGTQNGICYFDSKSSFIDSKPSKTVITNFSVAEKKYAYTGDLTDFPVKDTEILPYNQNTFSVSFNIMDYSLNDKIEFSYQMKGLDDSWYNIKNNKELTFRNLRPGKYLLNIKSRLRNQPWNENVSSMTIIINPPFWLSWWAKLIYSIVLMVIAFFLLRFYKRKLDLENSLYLEKKNHLQEQELNNERLRFFTNITHELRTPLTLIIGPLEDLIADNSLQKGQLKKINSIHHSAKRLLDLINQILEFRKSETSNRKLSVKQGNISNLAHEIWLKYKEINQNQNVEFRIDLPTDPVEIYYDTEVITIILDNLISNAMKYTNKGNIILKISNKTVANTLYTEIQVADTGVGIPADSLSRIFDRYYQVKGKHQASGTGIGLSLVKNMMELHQATISVESTLGIGTTFSLQFLTHNTYPDALHCETEIEITDEQIHSLSMQVMLIVEDNIEIQEYIHDCFEDAFEILLAENGKKGLQIAIERLPDIIISDIMMPVMDGMELCQTIKNDIRTCHIPIILLTAKDSLQDKTEGYNVGADSYLTKPFSGNLLKSRVNNILESRKKIADLFKSTIVNKQDIVKSSISKLDNEFIDKLTKIIEANLEIEQLNIAQIANQMYMSHSTLYRKIKSLTGLSANEFIRKIKMNNAERMLLTYKYSITEIIFKVGISTPSYFRQCFKEEFGVTPTEYLQNIKDGKEQME